VTELLSLVNHGAVGPAVSPAFNTNCAQWCTVLTCSCTLGSNTFWYWTSTAFHTNPSFTWAVFFFNGVADRTHVSQDSLTVRAVRGGS
jgi:hypothetical protein